MRGHKKQQETLFSLRTLVDRVPKDHPLRRVKDMADAALAALSPTFEKMYSKMGRPSIPPEQLLKASLLMASTRCAASDCSASNSTTTCSSGGFSTWASRMLRSTTARFRRTTSVYSSMMSLGNSSLRSWNRPRALD